MSVANHGKHARQSEVVIPQSDCVTRIFPQVGVADFYSTQVVADRSRRSVVLQLLTLRDRLLNSASGTAR